MIDFNKFVEWYCKEIESAIKKNELPKNPTEKEIISYMQEKYGK